MGDKYLKSYWAEIEPSRTDSWEPQDHEHEWSYLADDKVRFCLNGYCRAIEEVWYRKPVHTHQWNTFSFNSSSKGWTQVCILPGCMETRIAPLRKTAISVGRCSFCKLVYNTYLNSECPRCGKGGKDVLHTVGSRSEALLEE